MASQEVAPAKVASIFIYPIKSCRGISVSEAPLASTGMNYTLVTVATLSISRICFSAAAFSGYFAEMDEWERMASLHVYAVVEISKCCIICLMPN